MTTATQREQHEEIGRRRVVFLLDACSRTELGILRRWIEEHHVPTGIPYDAIPIPPTRRRRRTTVDARLDTVLAADDDPMLTPLRVAWLPGPAHGGPRRRFFRLLLLGDPRDPGRMRQAVGARQVARYQVVAGEAAPASELRERWRRAGGADLGETTGLADFVTRQAALALERAERRVRGLRYKVPRFVHEDILARPAFRAGITRLAHELGRPQAAILRDAQRYLKEIAATHSPYVIDLTAQLIHLLYTRAYGEALHYDRGDLEDIYTIAQRYPVVFLPSHKSNLDHLVLQYALHENGHPPNHTAGGINMNFFPVGPLVRRSGVFFIRRTFKDNPVYKFVLQHYIDYLIEKRFTLEWYIEGGRSRSGKLLPPRFGLLANVVDAYRRGKSEDVFLIPVAIAYDQIQDVGSYTAEQHGAAKQTENFGWFVNVIRGLQTRFGDIYIRFGKPISLAQTVGPPDPLAAEHGSQDDTEEQHLSIQKLAFEVAVRINRVTPITPTSLVAMAMLGRGDRALSAPELVVALQNLVQYIRRRALPTTIEIGLDSPTSVQRTLVSLVASGVVTCYAEGPEPVYAIGPDQHLTAAYYRNTIIHFFVTGAIALIWSLFPTARGCCRPARTTSRTGARRSGAKPCGCATSSSSSSSLRRRNASATSWRRRSPCTTTSGSPRSRADPRPSRASSAPSAPSTPTACSGRTCRPTGSSRIRSSWRRPTRRSTRTRSSAAAWDSASSTCSSAASRAPNRCRRCCSIPRSSWRATASYSTRAWQISSTVGTPSPRRSAPRSGAPTPSSCWRRVASRA